MTDSGTLLCVDMGTTRTRVWLVQGERVRTHLVRDFGVRDSAQVDLESALIDLLQQTTASAGLDESTDIPRKVAAAGMISSPQGLLEVPHLPAPTGREDLWAAVRRIRIGTDRQYEMLLVPGVRTGNGAADIAATLDSDVMRGEETLCVGLLSQGLVRPGDAVLNLGSHWKWIWIDESARIAGSRTALTGEMIHAIQSNTLLAAALPQRRPLALENEWLALGAAEARRSGLSRALFCMRLLQQAKHGSEDQHLAFLYGAFLEVEAEALLKVKVFENLRSACIVGASALAEAWKARLEQRKVSAIAIGEAERDAAYLAGLRKITDHIPS